MNFAIVRPLVFKYAKLDNLAVVYACLVVRSHFINLVDDNLADANIMASRAMMCELLAIKLVRHFANDKIQLASVLTTSWSPVAGAPPGIVNEVRRSLGGDEREMDDPANSLEVCLSYMTSPISREYLLASQMAIATRAKAFLASPAVQSVVNDIYSGRLVFSTASNRALLADNYKPRPVELHDPRKTPFLDHYR